MTVLLASNALTKLDTLKAQLGILTSDHTQDDELTRMVNAASQTAEQFCNRKFGYVAAELEDVAGYGTELVHVKRSPLWQVQSVTTAGQALSADYFYIQDHEIGSVRCTIGFPNTAPIELSAEPHYRSGYEEKLIEIAYSGGFALPSTTAAVDRIASDCPAWTALTAYAANAKVTNGDNVYVCTASTGSSAASGGPTGKGSSITDAAVTWAFLCTAFPLPWDLEEAVLELCVFRWRRRGRDVSVQSETVGRASRLYEGSRQSGPDGVPTQIADIFNLYTRPF